MLAWATGVSGAWAYIRSKTIPLRAKASICGVRPCREPRKPMRSARTVSDLLHQGGYRTAAFVSSIILDPRNGFAPGFERGFDSYDAGFHRRHKGENRYQSVERRAERSEE